MKEETKQESSCFALTSIDLLCCVVAYGGGVNSTAMLIGLWQRGERPDAILFSDTGGERPETYKFVSEFSKWLTSRNFPPITILRSPNATLEQDVLRRRALPALAYGFKSCSLRFKSEPQEKFCNNWQLARETWAQGGKVTKLVGYDYFEQRRAKNYDNEKYKNRYPLIEWEWTRDNCETVCKEQNLYPSKSACFFCPASTRSDILKLKREHPKLLERALRIERNAELGSVKGLGRRFAWADVIFKEQIQGKLFDESEIDLPCGCYDG